MEKESAPTHGGVDNLASFKRALEHIVREALNLRVPEEDELDRLLAQAARLKGPAQDSAAYTLVAEAIEQARQQAKAAHQKAVARSLYQITEQFGLRQSSAARRPKRSPTCRLTDDLLEQVKACFHQHDGARITRRELADTLQLSDTQSKRIIRQLITGGYIATQGSGRYRTYQWKPSSQ